MKIDASNLGDHKTTKVNHDLVKMVIEFVNETVEIQFKNDDELTEFIRAVAWEY